MSWTYTGVPGIADTQGRRDAVRYFIKDTNSARQKIQDEEIDFLLSQNNNNVYAAAADACDQLQAGEAKSKSVGDLSLSGMGETYADLAKRYRMRLAAGLVPFAGGISVGDKDSRALDTDRTTPFFTRALHVNPETGSTGAPST